MKEYLKRLDGQNRRQFIANTAKACLGVSVLPAIGDKALALTPGQSY